MKIKNETEIQLMKILFKTSGGKATKNITSRRAYPHGTESKYFRQLKSFFKPLTDYVNKYIEQHSTELLRGDSSTMHVDAIPGDSFRGMIENLNGWVEMYMPEIGKDTESSTNNFILKEIKKTADDVLDFDNNDFSKMVHKGINVDVPITSPWWNDMRSSWAEDNYSLIVSNAKNYVSEINTLTEQAVVNGFSARKLTDNIKQATTKLTDKHCKLLARDQIGKLNGQITESQMQEIGLDLYVWSTSNDDRVRESHAIMEGLLCRWDDASVCSYDNGKTWVDRPAGAVELHPGQDIQCRCVPLAFFPELTAEVEGKELVELTEDLPPVQQEMMDVSSLNVDEITEMNYEQTVELNEKLQREYEETLKAFRNETNEELKAKLLSKGKHLVELKDMAKVHENVLITASKIPLNYEDTVSKLNSFDNLYEKYKAMSDDVLNAKIVGRSEKEITQIKENYFKALNIKDIKPTNEWFKDEKGVFQFGELNVYKDMGVGDLVELASKQSTKPVIMQPKIYQDSLGNLFSNDFKYSKITEKEAVSMLPKGYTLNGISNAENRALTNYSHFTPYNKFLREGGDVMSKTETATIKKVIDRTNSDGGVFYRGVRGDFVKELDKLNVGDTFTEKSFMSTSSDLSVAENFAGKEGAIMKINSKGGIGKSIFISPSEFGMESETLFNAGSKLKLVGKKNNIFEFDVI